MPGITEISFFIFLFRPLCRPSWTPSWKFKIAQWWQLYTTLDIIMYTLKVLGKSVGLC